LVGGRLPLDIVLFGGAGIFIGGLESSKYIFNKTG
jgi:hypothetical protein